MEIMDRLAAEADCTRLMNAFAWAMDAFDDDTAIAMFVPDCIFSRDREVFEGVDGLRAVFARRPRDRRTCHLLSNIVIDVRNGAEATGKAHALVFGYRGEIKDGEEAPLRTPDSIVRFEASFANVQAGWRITRWHIVLNFRRPVT